MNGSRCRTRLGFLVAVSAFWLLIAADAYGIWIDSYLGKVSTTQVREIEVVLLRRVEESWQEVDIVRGRFSDNGDLLQESRYTSEGALQFEYAHSYDDKGQMIASTGKRMRQGKIVTYEYRYRYDERGNQTESVSYGPDGEVLSKYTARFDGNNNFAEGTSYEGEEPVSRYAARYDSNSNLVEESKYTLYRYQGELREQLDYRYGYSYDDKNNLVEERGFAPDGSLKYRYRYRYDAHGNLVEGISYADGDAVLSRYVARYDDRNNLVESTKYGEDGEVTSWHAAEYDAANRLIREKNLLGDTPKIIYEAAYDAQGNLLEEAHLGENGLGGSGLDYRYSYRYDERGNRVEETYHVYFPEEDQWKPISRQTNRISYQR
ncbi:MAG: hypothetical protein JW820_18960 [Spirochaetales bacterium]|nr:hypothetical protein [Spirochaetales bacterium]